MQNIVLTGPATRRDGTVVLRDDVIARAKAFGFNVQGSVQATTDMLVASRTDTVKAQKAKAKGISVISYPDLFDWIGDIMTRTEQGQYVMDLGNGEVADDTWLKL